MRGQVLGVDVRTGDGIVLGEDGRRYSFRPDDWAHRGEPGVGMQVDFESKDSRALSLFPLPAPASAPAISPADPLGQHDRNKYVAATLAFLLGTLGIHRFYLGRTGSAIGMLVLSFTFVGLLIAVPWALIDTVRFLMMSDSEFAQRYARKES